MAQLAVFAAALALYAWTAAPTVVWGDSAYYVLDAWLNVVRVGTASSHPLYVEIARPLVRLPGDPGYHLALLSAVFGAAAVALVFRLSRQLDASAGAAAIGAAALAVSHGFWLHAVVPEVYTANACFLLASLSALLSWRRTGRARWLFAAALAFLVGLANHLVLLLVLPALLAFVVMVRRDLLRDRRTWVVAAAVLACAAVAAGLAIGPLSRAVYQLWVGPPGLSDYVRLELPLGAMGRELLLYVAYLGYQFPTISFLFVCIGVRALIVRDRQAAVLILLAVALNAAVFIHHTGWESRAKFVFYISDYALLSVACAIGADRLLEGLRSPTRADADRAWLAVIGVLTVAVPPAVYAVAPGVAARIGVDLARSGRLAYRNDAAYFLKPGKRGYDGARRFAEESLRLAGPSAVIYADYTPFTVLRYLQRVEGVRPDIALIFKAERPLQDDRVAVAWLLENGRPRPTYIASRTLEYYDLSRLTGGYDLVPVGPLLEVRPRE